MDVPRLLDRLQRFVAATALGRRPADPPGVVNLADTRRPVGLADELTKEAELVESIFDRVLGGDWREPDKPGPTDRWQHHRRAALRAIARLESFDEVATSLGDDSPVLSASGLHAWVWEGARSLWASGHYAEAVAAAARQVNAETQSKIGRRDISEADLFTQAFSDNTPSAAQPRLRPPGDDNGRSAKSLRRGIRSYAEGCYAALRNPAAHEVQVELPEDEALEQLAAFSVLARWVDRADEVSAP